MSAFQSYAGVYESRDGRFTWRCYATVRVYGVRRAEHGPCPRAPEGKKWMRQPPHHHTPDVSWLVDDTVHEFSHILLQVLPDAASWSSRPLAVEERATA